LEDKNKNQKRIKMTARNLTKKSKIIQYVYIIAFMCVLVGSIGHFFEYSLFKYIFSLGALTIVVNHLWVMYKTKQPDFREKRLLRINLFLSLILALAAYSMFDGTSLWVVLLLIYALVTMMLSFRNPKDAS
jgi:hypothetical protein